MHPATNHIMQYFTYEHLPPSLQSISKQFTELAEEMVNILPENPETTVVLRKLLEAKDAAVRSQITGQVPSAAPPPESAICGETYGESTICILKPGHDGAHEAKPIGD